MCTTKQPFSGKCRSIYMPRKAIITKEMSWHNYNFSQIDQNISVF
jgi:hypothetical protein